MAAPRFELVLVEGKAAPTRVKLRASIIVLGRDPACDVVLEDGRASSRHAKLAPDPDGWILEDLGSSNGTFLGDIEVTRSLLQAGDRFRVGDTVLALEEGASSAPAPRVPARTPPPPPPPRAPAPSPSRARVAPAAPSRAWTDAAPRLLESLAALLSAGAGGGSGDLLEGMLDELLAAFEADRGAIFLPAGEGGFEPRWSRRAAGTEIEEGEPISQSVIRRVAESGEVALLTSAETEELRREIHSIAGSLRSLLAAPIPLPEGPGVLYLESVLERRRFRRRDGEVLGSFARVAGDMLARDRARLDATRRSERMEELQRRELARAEIVGDSGPMRAVLSEITKAAGTDVSVLVTGESGTGKELVARALHRASRRADRAFVPVNCAALPAELVESELFGHEPGAFTGATGRRLGHFELADGGTLFLDEAGELPLPAQAKLLRALQERTIQRVGGNEQIPVDFRLVCATNVRLEDAVAAGTFREDLFYRIAVFRIPLPPLRRRGEDIGTLAEFFLTRFAREFRRPVAGIDPAARALLLEHGWPGNIRELRNVIEQAVVREEGATLGARAVMPALGIDPWESRPGTPAGGGSGLSMDDLPRELDAARRGFEKRFLEHRIAEHKGNMKATSEAIGLSRKALYVKCDEYGIDYKRFR